MSTESSSTLSPLPDEMWPEEIKDMTSGFAGALNVYRVMAHHPALLRAWAPLRQHVVKDSSLGLENSEIVILRTGFRMGSKYEIDHHVTRARALGMSDERIKAVLDKPSEEKDGMLVQAVDTLFEQHKLDQRLEKQIAQVFGQSAVFDIMATVGFYIVLGNILMTYDVPVDEGVAKQIEDNPL
eukprot:Nitzschia sp. Nitz4//scaffold24_size164493//34696//35244//NITZ4_CMD//1//CDS//3329544204//1914//frame0